MEADLKPVIRRNTLVLASCLALSWAVVQLLVAVAAPVFAELTGRRSIAGVGPAIALAFWAVGTLLVGRYMDVRGRGPGIRLGFAVAAVGYLVLFFAIRARSLSLYVVALAVAGAGGGAINLARAGGGDMYPPERRARGISFVLFGAAFGAILGPLLFIPLLARAGADIDVLASPFVVGALVMVLGIALTWAIRVDPIEIGRMLRERAGSSTGAGPQGPARHLAVLLHLPNVQIAVTAAVISQGVMAMMMSTISLHLRAHGHSWTAVSVALSAHFLGMFGLVLVVGRWVDRVGRERALIGGLLILIAGSVALLGEVELGLVAPAMLVVGIGWNVSFVAATAMLADATAPAERAGLLGFADFLGMTSSAVSSLFAGVLIGAMGIGALVAVGAALALVPVALFAARRHHARVTASHLGA